MDREFQVTCNIVERVFTKDWEGTEDYEKNRKLEREKKAIMGFEVETAYYKERIREILREKRLMDSEFPSWFPDIVEAVFAELYGLSGLAPWAYDMNEEYRRSSSAKLIGDRLYCLIDGVSVLQPQKISEERRLQLKMTLLLATPKERLEYGFHEVYLQNGIRITIYSGDRTKPNQDIMVFRKYILQDLSFDKMVELKTIPLEAMFLFKSMIKIGYNVIFAGQVRSGKTTFMQTWQKYENPDLEGLAIATDPETPWHKIMPQAPIMQLVADGEDLEKITKSLLRGDNDYVLLEEMRDAAAFNLALDITSTGTMRSKATIHDGTAVNIPYKMAAKISEKYGGSLNELIAQVYKNFDFIIEFSQHPKNKAQKIMKGISELSYNFEEDRITIIKICEYDFLNEKWNWNNRIEQDVLDKGINFPDELNDLKNELFRLNKDNPLNGETFVVPAYYKSSGRNFFS